MSTEARNPRSLALDKMSVLEIVELMNAEESAVLKALESASKEIAQAAEKVAEAFQSGGRTVYVGSGTSGRIAAMDAAEMGATFGVEDGRFIALVAQDIAKHRDPNQDAEDDEHAAIEAINELQLTPQDVVIGLAASGFTPFTVAALRHARQKGVWTCGIASRPQSRLIEEADLGILLPTGPEVLTGSTRLKAGTAQKLALNRISTAAMVMSGKVVENLMVDVKASNAKLQERCIRIVRELTSATAEEARELLARHSWSVREVLSHLNGSNGR
jgi:N-acetylmuramic acid 6-phosphate etherase